MMADGPSLGERLDAAVAATSAAIADGDESAIHAECAKLYEIGCKYLQVTIPRIGDDRRRSKKARASYLERRLAYLGAAKSAMAALGSARVPEMEEHIRNLEAAFLGLT